MNFKLLLTNLEFYISTHLSSFTMGEMAILTKANSFTCTLDPYPLAFLGKLISQMP